MPTLEFLQQYVRRHEAEEARITNLIASGESVPDGWERWYENVYNKHKSKGRQRSDTPSRPPARWITTELRLIPFLGATGLLGRVLDEDAGKVSCLCINEDEHSTGEGADDTDTTAWDGRDGQYPGYKCQHAHCTEITLQTVLDKYPQQAVQFGAALVVGTLTADFTILQFGGGIDELDRIPPRIDIVEGVLPARQPAGLVASTDCGKSVIAVDLLCHVVAEALEWHGQAINTAECGDVLIIVGEQSAGMRDLLRGWVLEHPDLPLKHRFLFVDGAVELADPTTREAFTKRVVQDFSDRRIVCVLVETLQANYGNKELDSNTDMRVFLRQGVDGLCHALGGCASIITHHSGWDKSREKGASAFGDHITSRWMLTRQNKSEDVIRTLMESTKSKGATMPPTLFRIERRTAPSGWTYATVRAEQGRGTDGRIDWFGLNKPSESERRTIDVLADHHPEPMNALQIAAITGRSDRCERDNLNTLNRKGHIDGSADGPGGANRWRLTEAGAASHPVTRPASDEEALERLAAELRAEMDGGR